MPELPEVEITARRLGDALRGTEIESALAPGINALKTFHPPLSALSGRHVVALRRRGKHLIVDFDGSLSLLIHLMSAGRLQLYETRAGPRDRSSRLLVRLSDGRELRLREFGTRQAAWVRLLGTDALQGDEVLAGLGPEAWPVAPPLEDLDMGARPLNAALRDQHVIAGIGRSWADEILWECRLSPFKRSGDLSGAERTELRSAIEGVLGAAIEHYEAHVTLPIPDRMPMPLRVHRREGEPCPRCGTTLAAVHFQEHVIAYCPTCQTDGRVLKDRRLSRLLK